MMILCFVSFQQISFFLSDSSIFFFLSAEGLAGITYSVIPRSGTLGNIYTIRHFLNLPQPVDLV